jgi:hypothetical protein
MSLDTSIHLNYGDPIIWPKSGTGYPTPMFISVLSLEIQLSGPSQGLDIQHGQIIRSPMTIQI